MATVQEVTKREQELSSELQNSQEVIEVFTTALAELEQTLGAFKVKLETAQQPEKIKEVVNELYHYLVDMAIKTLNYQTHFLSPFDRLVRTIERQIESMLARSTPEEYKDNFESFLKDLFYYKKMVERFVKSINIFTDVCMNAFLVKRATKNELKLRLENTAKILVPMAKRWSETEIPNHLNSMQKVIDKARDLARSATSV